MLESGAMAVAEPSRSHRVGNPEDPIKMPGIRRGVGNMRGV
jgi:hypothetical protein